jgi:hypothetical protein
MNSNGNGKVIDRGVLTISAAVAVLLTGIGSAVWLNTTLLSLAHKIEVLGDRLHRLEHGEMADRWGRNDMKSWSSLLRTANPALTVPTIDQVR